MKKLLMWFYSKKQLIDKLFFHLDLVNEWQKRCIYMGKIMEEKDETISKLREINLNARMKRRNRYWRKTHNS